MQETYARTDPERRVLIRYEEMRADPVAALERICSMLGIEASREQLEEIAGTHSFSSVPKSDKGAGREIRRAEPGGWANHMTREEITRDARDPRPTSSTSSATCARATSRPRRAA